MARPFTSLVPSIEHRLGTWRDIQQRLHQAPQLRLRPTVTLSRSFGCEGYPVAERIKVALEAVTSEPWNVYDKTLLEAVSKNEGVSMEVLKHLGTTAGALERMGLMPKGYYERVQAWDAQSHQLVQIAGAGNAVIVGRGGAVLCHELANCFHFRIDAPFEWRVESMAKRLELPRKEAEDFVKANSALRDDFIRKQLKAEPSDLANFDAVFNNARHGAAEISAAIVAYVREAWPRVAGTT